jgi:hypothetical protein
MVTTPRVPERACVGQTAITLTRSADLAASHQVTCLGDDWCRTLQWVRDESVTTTATRKQRVDQETEREGLDLRLHGETVH